MFVRGWIGLFDYVENAKPLETIEQRLTHFRKQGKTVTLFDELSKAGQRLFSAGIVVFTVAVTAMFLVAAFSH